MTEVLTEEILKKVYQKREQGKYYKKYSFGLLLVIGGSEFYSGSPALNALAAFKAGVDMVRIFAPERAANIIASFSPILAAYPLKGAYLGKEHLSTLLFQIESAKEVSKGNCALVIGGGLGRSPETKEAVLEILKKVDIPCVIDADGIYAISEEKEIIKDKKVILTPHMYEFFILSGKEVEKLSDEEKSELVRKEAEKLGVTILLKTKPDIISDGKRIALNQRGSPFMSVGGTGDVLAGICGALLSRKIEPFEAACAGVYLNCLAGEKAGQKLGESLTAIDVIEAISEVLKDVGCF
jgi:NAD(P)H-hydrate epimerase